MIIEIGTEVDFSYTSKSSKRTMHIVGKVVKSGPNINTETHSTIQPEPGTDPRPYITVENKVISIRERFALVG